jgi:pimeloyl-ACP methyl ester carboxylesterase
MTETRGPGDAGMDVVHVEGAPIAYRRSGSGPPLLLLHGLPGDSRMWRPQLSSLSDDFTVVAWDAPGCGRSPAPSENLTLGDVGRYLVGFIHELRLDQPAVVGISWGGGLALELYRQAPDVLRALVLASAYAGWAGSLPDDMVSQRLAAYLQAAASAGSESLQHWAPGFFASDPPQTVVDEVIAIVSDIQPAALTSLARSFAETDLRPVLPTIKLPVLLLYGDGDTRAPLFVAEALHDAIPAPTLHVLAGVGHVSNFEDPQGFEGAVRAFLVGGSDDGS